MGAVGRSLVTIPSGRRRGGFRLRSDDDIDRLRLITPVKPLGFSLEQMRHLPELQMAEALDETRRRGARWPPGTGWRP